MSAKRKPLVVAAGVAGLAALAACNSGPVASVAPGQDPVSQRIGNLLAFNSTNAPRQSGPAGPAGPRVDCPIVQVEPGASSFRSASGDSASGVRYQISIGDIARECAVEGNRVAIRVGVETNLVLGPAGSPGSYSAPLRVSIRRQFDESVVVSKTYRVGGAVGAAGSAQFSLVADALTIPYENDRPSDDYEVVVGFGEGSPTGGRRSRR